VADRQTLASFYPHRSKLFRFFWPFTHALITNITVTFGYVFFKLLNKTIVVGREHVPRGPNTLLMANHQTMIDSFVVGIAAYYPASLIRPQLIPWNPAAEENLYKTRVVGWLADNWKCIPIKRGRKDLSAIRKIGTALRFGPVLLFPEGTRSRSGAIGDGRGGAGLMILETNPTVVPVCIDGMDKVLPIGASLPRIFKRIYIRYGKPIDLTEFRGLQRNRETAVLLMRKIMDSIRSLKQEIEESKQANPPPTRKRSHGNH
jgi:1-acyl-sn-glycerol-3-phosphate acyltransferase